MALKLLGGAEFLHIPKTGGSWVTSVLEENQLIEKYQGHKHADYDYNLFRPALSAQEILSKATEKIGSKVSSLFGSQEPISQDVFRFCFVRHPLSWYESWWKYMKGRGWNDWGAPNSTVYWHPSAPLNGLGSEDFNEFVYNVIQKRPGYVTELFYSFTKAGISFIGKTENLAQDLIKALDYLGLTYETSSIVKAPKKNVSKTPQSEIEWDPKLRALVMRMELPALLHFGYLEEEEKKKLGVSHEVAPNPALNSLG